MKDLDELKKETEHDLRDARERRLDRQARERRDGPILDAYDRLAGGQQLELIPGPRHAPRLAAVPEQPTSEPRTTVVNIRRDAALVKQATAEGRYVYIGRGRGSKWGNPFTFKAGTLAEFVVPYDEVLPRFEAWLRQQPDLMRALPELRGKVLGCWCKPGPCHGDVLARLVEELTR